MSLSDYLRACAPDFAACVLLSTSLGMVNCTAFFIRSDLQFSLLALAVGSAAPLVLLFAAAYSRKTVLPGIAVIVVALALACQGVHVLWGSGPMFVDSEDNPETFVLVMSLTSAVVFLLTRRRWMSRLFVLIAIVDICFVEYLYRQHCWQALLVALVAAGTMVVFRNYRLNLSGARVGSVSFASAVGIGMAYSLAIVGLSCAVFFSILAPLDPAALEFKPFTRYMTYETVQMTGVGDASPQSGASETTGSLDGDLDKTNRESDLDGSLSEYVGDSTGSLSLPDAGSLAELGQAGMQTLRDLFNFLVENPARLALSLLLLLLLAASPYVVKKLLRRHWFAQSCALPPGECIERLYSFFIKGFGKLKVEKGESETLDEFVASRASALAEFAYNERGVDFAELTRIYSDSVYGGCEPTDEDLESFKAFYRHYHKAFITLAGRLRYIVLFFGV